MAYRTPTQIQEFLDANMHRMDGPQQMFGDEPNAYLKDWDAAKVRGVITASWPYTAAAGNQSVPSVYVAINRRETALCDRFYLPATPRDLRMFEKNGYPLFGIESKHPWSDFDVVMTSISYPVLIMSFHKMLTVAGIPARRSVREQDPGQHPMIMVGGQIYGDPECLAPIIDCMWLGEVEDEPGNPGIQAVFARIEAFKESGRWVADRLSCYADLAREFNFLYFPRFVDVHYGYEDRSHVEVGPELSKQVVGYTSNLEGMRMPFLKRIVKDMNAVPPLDAPPLLYADIGMGAGDLEVGRGCPAWCSFCALTYRQKPYRQRSVDYMVEAAKNTRDNMGASRLAPFMPDFPMHSCSISSSYLQLSRGLISIKELLDLGKDIPTGTHVRMSQFESSVRSGDGSYPLFAAYHTSFKPVHHVRTSNGTRLEVTGDHLVQRLEVPGSGGRHRPLSLRQRLDKASPVFVPARELRTGDYLRVFYGQQEWPEAPVALEPIAGLPDTLTQDAAWLLGLFSGDGWHIDYGIEFAVPSPAIESEVKRIVESFGLTWGWRYSDPSAQRVLRVSGKAGRWLSRNFGIFDKETKRQVPLAVRMSPRPVVEAYLRGVLDADGCVPVRDTDRRYLLEVTHTTSRENFSRQLAALFTALGHPVSLVRSASATTTGREDSGPFWNLSVKSGTDVDWSWLRFAHEDRQAKLEEALFNGLSVPEKLFPATGDLGHYYVKVQANLADVEIVEVGDVEVPDVKCFNVNGMVVHNTQRKKLVNALLENVSDEVDAPAMRVDDFIADSDYILLQVHGGLDDVTLGVEGNSQRMRDLVGKGASDKSIKQAMSQGLLAGIRKFKFFMISDLPGEDHGDIMKIVDLARDLAAIRDNAGVPGVRIQFSWTPLLIEANTPFQWFAPTPKGSKALMDAWEEFRDLKIEFKIGNKAEASKAAFFQLCQRASRDVGEAILDAMEEAGVGCWGGVPRNLADRLEYFLKEHGFRNGYGDTFDERFLDDMFGWEFIDQGVSVGLLWATYTQMREFAEQTDSATYEDYFDDTYEGAEWNPRCDEACMGRSCGVCDAEDLRLRRQYILDGKTEQHVDLTAVRPVDQSTTAFKVRAKIYKPEKYRFVQNDHWRFNVRRAAFRTQTRLGTSHGISKRTIKFASDEIQFKDWTSGVDYLEFGMTRKLTAPQLAEFIEGMRQELSGVKDAGERWIDILSYDIVPANAKSIRSDIDLTFYELEIDEDPAAVAARIAAWEAAEYVKLVLKVDASYFNAGTEEVNGKDYVDGLWMVKDGPRLKIRMLVRGKPNPYEIYGVLMGRRSWIDAAANPANRVESFVSVKAGQDDFFRPNCEDCGRQIQVTIMDTPYDPAYCAHCKDVHDGASVQLV